MSSRCVVTTAFIPSGSATADLGVADGHDRLQPLRAHHRPKPAAARGPAFVVDHARQSRLIRSPAGPMQADAGLLAVKLLDVWSSTVVRIQPPPRVGRQELGLAVVQQQVDRLAG